MHSTHTSQPRPLASPFLSWLSAYRLMLVITGSLVLCMALCATAGLAPAQPAPSSGRNARAESLTQDLIDLITRYQLASPAQSTSSSVVIASPSTSASGSPSAPSGLRGGLWPQGPPR